MKHFFRLRELAIGLLLGLAALPARAQLDNDAIMMNRKQICNGLTWMYSTWDKYWEGDFKRNNQNIGRFTGQQLVYMVNYGITDNLNVMASVPYAWNHVSEGTLHAMHGFQDLSAHVKWRPVHASLGGSRLSLFAVAGFSTPLTAYTIDFLPLSIGLGSTTAIARVTADFQHGAFFTTFSGSYNWRGNVKLDRDEYYTTALHITNVVNMPNLILSNLNIGLRKKFWQAELILTDMVTQGGFDIRKNDMPFVSNAMNGVSAGLHGKYTLKFYPPVELIGGVDYVLKGRNMGQATSVMAGAFYRFTFHSRKKESR